MRLFFFSLIIFFGARIVSAQSDVMPAIVKTEQGSYRLMVDGKPFIVLGAQLWNSSDWPYILQKEWPQLRALHCNTLEAPVYWQNVEPQQGVFRWNELDSLILGARREGLRLVLLWMASYKNGSSSYAPDWVLMHPEKFPRMLNAGGEEMQVLSAVSEVNRDADKSAFVHLMQHVREIDEHQHTVILVQVENESGALGTDRDYSAAANAAFKKAVPAVLLKRLGKPAGTWESVFGIAAAEALAAGVPLIVSSTPALVEMVTPFGAGSEVGRVVPVGDASALAGAILYLLSRADERARLSLAGRAAAERFRWGDVASRHCEFLEHIAGLSLFPHAGSR